MDDDQRDARDGGKRRRDRAGLEDGRFAACIPIPFVTAGQHQFRLRWRRRKGDREPLAPDSSVPVTVFDREGNSVAAVGRAAVPVPLARRQKRPRVSLDGRPGPAAEWLCVRRATDFLGVLVVETTALRPGLHALEWTLSKQALGRRLRRLDIPG